jgi:hypothetical protein
MTWVALFNRLLAAFRAFADWVRSAKDIELGTLREKGRQRESDVAIRDAIDRAKPDRVSDDEAFGAFGSDNDLPRTFKGGPAGRSDS